MGGGPTPVWTNSSDFCGRRLPKDLLENSNQSFVNKEIVQVFVAKIQYTFDSDSHFCGRRGKYFRSRGKKILSLWRSKRRKVGFGSWSSILNNTTPHTFLSSIFKNAKLHRWACKFLQFRARLVLSGSNFHLWKLLFVKQGTGPHYFYNLHQNKKV